MRNTKSFVFKRQQGILKYLKQHKIAKTEDLAKQLHTSPITIRRDFQSLENQGVIKRHYGGAVLVENALHEDPSLKEQSQERCEIKCAIAKKAAEFIQDGDSIFINSSSTAIHVLEHIQNKRVMVITNNGKVLNANLSPQIELILTGGEVYGRKQSLVGDMATQMIAKITVSKCFLGISGITSTTGISTSVLQETAINMKMLENCNGPTYVLADSSKVGRHHNFFSGEIKDIDFLITDSHANAQEVFLLEKKGVSVLFAEKCIPD